MATSDLYRVQKLIDEYVDRCNSIEAQIRDYNKKVLELKREYNSTKDGVSYLKRMEAEILKKEERRYVNLRTKNKSRCTK